MEIPSISFLNGIVLVLGAGSKYLASSKTS